MIVENMEGELQCGNVKRYSFMLGERGKRVMEGVDYRRYFGCVKRLSTKKIDI